MASTKASMRRPSPALVVAMIALFAALGGAGYAASVAFVRSAQPIVLLPASVSADGKVTGPRMTGGRVSAGVYTLTIRGDSFAGEKISTPIHTSVTGNGDGTGTAAQFGTATPNPATCTVAKETMASNGSANVEVHCFTYDASAGWQPSDAAFDVQVVGPGR